MATRRLLFVKSDPTEDYSLGQCIGVYPTSHAMNSEEDGTNALDNGMKLSYVDLDISSDEEDSISGLGKKVDAADTPTAIEDI